MSPLTVGIIGIFFLFLLLALRMQIGFSMALVGFLGFAVLSSLGSSFAIMGMELTFDDQRTLRHYSENIKEHYCCGVAGCTGCKDKCPKGVAVKEINRCIGYANGYGDIRLAKENYSNLSESNRIDICSDCDECVVKCINGINLTENIRRARSLFA